MLKLLFYFCFFSLMLGQFANIFKDAGLSLYIFDIVIAIFVVTGIFYFISLKQFTVPKVLFLYILFIFWAIITLIKPAFIMDANDFMVSAFYLVRFVLYIGVGVVLFNMLNKGIITSEEIFKAIIFSGLALAFAGVIQLILLPDFETLDPTLGWDPHKNRLASTFFDPNFTGGYLAICSSVILYNLLVKKHYSKYYVVSGIVMMTSLLFTFSRSSWLAFAVIILIFGVFKSRWLLFLSIVLAFSAYFAVPRVQTRISGITDPADSAQFRLVSWKNTLDIAKDNLILGTGYNTFRYKQSEYGFLEIGTLGGHSGAGSDSSFLLVLATTGIVGFVIFCLAFFVPVFGIFLKNKNLGVLIGAVFSSTFIQSQFINAVFFPQILFILVVLLITLSYVRDSEFLN